MVFGLFGKNKKSEAFKETEALAQKGDLSSLYNLGVMHLNGMGVKRDPSAAYHAFSKAAERGHPRAQFNLAVMYNTGNGAAKNPVTAAHWFKQAADQGHADAAFNLSHLYFTGTGVAQDQREAHIYLQRAAEGGHPGAVTYMQQLMASAKANPDDLVKKVMSQLRMAAADPAVRQALLTHSVGLGIPPGLSAQVKKCLYLAEQASIATDIPADEIVQAMAVEEYEEIETAMRAVHQ